MPIIKSLLHGFLYPILSVDVAENLGCPRHHQISVAVDATYLHSACSLVLYSHCIGIMLICLFCVTVYMIHVIQARLEQGLERDTILYSLQPSGLRLFKSFIPPIQQLLTH